MLSILVPQGDTSMNAHDDALRRMGAQSNDAAWPDVDAADPGAALLRRAGLGDQQAFTAFYDHMSPLVHGVVLRVVRDPAQAEEVTQEVFVEIWRHAARFDGTRGSARAWATTLAHRRAIDRVRSEQATRERQQRDATAVAPADHDTVSHALDREFDTARVRRALANLSEVQRTAIELAYFGGHTYREVAVLLGVAEGTVKTRIRDAMIKLRDELAGEP